MKVLIIGSGGREHALGWLVRRQDAGVELLFAPGNGGTEPLGRNLPVPASDLEGLARAAEAERVDLTLVGPEAPLAAGVADLFLDRGLPVFGPTARAAEIESSKAFAKTLLRDHGVATAPFEIAETPETALRLARAGRFPKVLKADGLAAGKGVIIARTPEEAGRAVATLMEGKGPAGAGRRVLVESFLEGEEVSAFAIARGTRFRLLPLAQDHKRLGEGDTGPNTGGMGAYAPFPRGDAALRTRIEEEVFRPVLAALAAAGRPFSGLLYAGLMLVDGRPHVLEFNCRFGDPETQALALLLGPGFLAALRAVAGGAEEIPEVQAAPEGGHAAAVVLASAGYPEAYATGVPILGVEAAEALPETFVFHAGTARAEGKLVTAGGRVLAVSGRGRDLEEALRRAYDGCARIEFEGKYCRRDIGRRGLVGGAAAGGDG